MRRLAIEPLEDRRMLAGISILPVFGLVTTEAGDEATFTIRLDSEPTAPVTIDLSSSDTTEGIVSPESVIFEPENWNTAQTITVTGVDDELTDGDVTYTIQTAPAVSTDPEYDGFDALDVLVINRDDEYDFGDAPAPYATLLADGGAYHLAIGPTLGASRDVDTDGQPTVAADGDDMDGSDDEDGISFAPLIMVGQLDATVTVNVQNAPDGAKLDAWIDFNGDGSWGGSGEQIADRFMVSQGDNILLFDVPSFAPTGEIYARFRLSTAGHLHYAYHEAADGEVEDHLVTIESPVQANNDFGPQQVITSAAGGATSVHAADLDGDGDMDVLSASLGDDKIAWYENTDGLGSFGPQQVIMTYAYGARSVFAADLDGDGDMDVLSASYRGDKIAWYENTDGQGTFGPQQVIVALNGAISVHAADVDGDGDMDVLSASYSDDTIAWYENTDGRGTFGPQRVITSVADAARGGSTRLTWMVTAIWTSFQHLLRTTRSPGTKTPTDWEPSARSK